MAFDNANGAVAVRRRNVAACWASLRDLGEATVAQIAHATGLSRPTTQPIVRELASRGLAAAITVRADRPGRPGERYAFVPGAQKLACLDLGRNGTVVVARVDLASVITDVRVIRADAVDSVGERWRTSVAKLLGTQSIDTLVVSMPGVVTPDGRVLRVNRVPEWTGRLLTDVLDLTHVRELVVENHVNMSALAESRMGAGAEIRDQLYIHIAQGLKAGIVINGQMYRGASYAAGEGANVDQRGWSLNPEQVASTQLVAQLVGLIASPLAAMIGTLDPKVIVLGGPGAEIGGAKLRKKLSVALEAQLSARPVPTLRLGSLGNRAVLLGSAIRAVELGAISLFDGELVTPLSPVLKDEVDL